MTAPDAGALGPRNAQLKRLRRLAGRARDRREQGRFVIEGPTLVVEALAARLAIEAVYAEASVELPAGLDEQTVIRVADGALAAVLTTVTPQPVAAVAVPRQWGWDDLAVDRPVLVPAGIGDPGNLGSLWRSAEAAGCAGVVVVGHAVDPTNPKVVRAAAGAAFRLPLVVAGDFDEAVTEFHRQDRAVLATVVEPGCPGIDEVDLRRAAVVLGNEAHGLPPAAVAACDGCVHIPMAGPTESLGVAAAGAVIAFEALRQTRAASRKPLANPPSPEAN